MFAPLVTKAQMKAAASPTSKLSPPRSTHVARPFNGMIEQAHILQRSIGNQAVLRLLAPRASRSAGNEPSGDHEEEVAPESRAASKVPCSGAWDFSKIPLYPADRTSRSKAAFPRPGNPKLSVGEVNDPLEHEADRVADRVMRMPDAQVSVGAAPLQITRKCAACEAPAIVHDVLRLPGHPLDAATRAYFEPRFGRDFSRVRVHTDRLAAASVRNLNANAYTVGHDIVFGEGRFAPGTRAGRRLIAHELAHIVQQSDADRSGVVETIQRDVAIVPVSSEPEHTLDHGEIVGALAHNQKWFTDATLIAEIRDVLGIARMPAVIDEEFVLAVARWQAANGITQDGRIGRITKTYLAAELDAEGRPLTAQQLRNLVPVSHVADIDIGFCGCQEELTDTIDENLEFIGVYGTCRDDPDNHTGQQIEDCVTAHFAALGIDLHTAGTTSGAGEINVGPSEGHCGALKSSETFAHEWSHSSHQRELVRTFGSGTPAFEHAWNESTDWANDEIRARVVGNNFLLWLIARLNQICSGTSTP